MKAGLRLLVRTRAECRCEYCRFPEDIVPGMCFHFEHIVPRKHAGGDDADNLALACYLCNLHKGPNLTGIDPHSGQIEPLFHPRNHVWGRHFRWNGPVLMGRTAIGRTTIRVLSMNLPSRVRLRQRLMDAGLFPD